MPILRLAYVALFLIALIAVFALWSEVGGQGHLDLMPWYAKLLLGGGAAFAAAKATAAAVADKRAWNHRTRRWSALLLALLLACGLATYYCHLYLETDEDGQDSTDNSALLAPAAQPTHPIGFDSAGLREPLPQADSGAPTARTKTPRSCRPMR